jgi:two-component system phosphate regulon sensor histidine kinase PhoR
MSDFRRFSFQLLILAGSVLVVAVTLAIVGVLLTSALRDEMIDQTRRSLLVEANILTELAKDRWRSGTSPERTDRLAGLMAERARGRVTLIAPDGRVLGDSKVPLGKLKSLENHANRPEVRQALQTGLGWSLRHSATLGFDLLYVARLLGDRARPQLIVRLSLPLADMEETLFSVRRIILYSLLIGVLLSLGAAYLVARRIARPVKELTEAAKRLGSGDLTYRLRRYPPHEVGDLGRAFDRMADDLLRQIETAKEGRDRLAAILAGMVEGVLVFDREGKTVLANRAASQMLGLGPDPLGLTPAEIVRHAPFQEAVAAVLAGQERRSFRMQTLGPVPSILEVQLARLTEGQAGAVAVFHDVTQLHRTDQIRRDFVANVSHELRTPLTSIKGSVETLLDGGLEAGERAVDFVEMIGRNADRLHRLVDDLLELTRIESGAAPPEAEAIEVAEAVDSVLETAAGLAAEYGVTLARNLPGEPLGVMADRYQLEQALGNLLDNAIKYTGPNGRVVVEAERVGDEVAIRVVDNGPGIEPEHLSRIFERFYRVDKNRSRELGGTGLGLAIVKHIAHLGGGRVEVQSKPGRGSTFSLFLPATGQSRLP